MKTAIITKLEELLNQPAGEVANDVRTLQKEYQKQWTTEFETAKQSFIDEGGKAKEFIIEKNAEDTKITALFEKLKVEAVFNNDAPLGHVYSTTPHLDPAWAVAVGRGWSPGTALINFASTGIGGRFPPP